MMLEDGRKNVARFLERKSDLKTHLAFSDYEIEYVVADLEVNTPPLKGSLKVTMKKKNAEQ